MYTVDILFMGALREKSVRDQMGYSTMASLSICMVLYMYIIVHRRCVREADMSSECVQDTIVLALTHIHWP